jgi:hypothetical protein
MGKIATRLLLDKGVRIVGAVARSPSKVGRDLGDVPYRFLTRSTLINRIPDVIAAKPGLITLDRLGKPHYKHGQLLGHLIS